VGEFCIRLGACMTRPQANNILDLRRAGQDMPESVVTRALELTGDIEPDVVREAVAELEAS